MMKYSPFSDEPEESNSSSNNNSEQNSAPKPKHPIAIVFHYLFKIIAILIFIFGGLFSLSFVLTFIIVVLASAFDFWTVKNVTGRLLVGLRWWNEIKEDGSNNWIFESVQDKSQINPAESLLFWGPTILLPVIWIFFMISSIFSAKLLWLVVVIVCFALSAANLYGYIKCAKDARKKVKGMAQTYIVNSIVNQAINQV
ncbi:hypothetical protein DICPUDRAFT_93170 [Dictyostelium purpureum]|uniref:Golgi apparatus membrane protein TVP23 homolog n=1 Tax=Dictyostelium purpureum TaxID=5786 RepID=F1A3A2_DICPU|nr:uncharacterized protein DICPUDRAFT_93170 [Dictyostelium purpureum]EGC29330.1 hypothetical protein DICPUDRAFT_93170 [Dictyostelium purpureum]|eukprot:XP_003294146.1 hypothetical protein DICPUDRAFT_93170 [Dictyostelium purpureum]